MTFYRPFYRDFTEWNSARDCGANRPDGESEHAPDEDLEELFDAAIRHRFGVFISRAKMDPMHVPRSTGRNQSRRR